MDQASKFFQAMYQFCEGNEINFRYLPSGKQNFISLESFLSLPILPSSNENLYFAVATRNGGGTKDHIAEIPAAWCDIDFKDIPKGEANDRLKHFSLRPSILVNSGGGYHPYWIFKEPLEKKYIPELEILLKRLATYFNGDMASTDASRILRVPGTLNHKYKPPRQVKVTHIDPSLTYEPEDFDQILPELKGPVDSNGHLRNERGWQNESLKGVLEGNRHRDALRLAGRWAVKGHSPEEIAHFIVAWNQNNDPPKESLADPNSKEIQDIISYVTEKNEKGHTRSQKENALKFPYHVMAGAAGDFARLYGSYLETPKEFLFMSYLTCLGSALSGRLTLASEIAPQPRLFVVLLGESADERKSTVLNKTIEFFKTTMENFTVCWGVGSAEGLQKRLEKNGQLLLCFDEFKQFVNKSKIEASVLLPCVNTLFESNCYESRTKKTDISLEDAHLTFLAASTTSTYENIWTSQFVDIGFNNRLFLVPGSSERKFSVPAKIPETDKYRLKRQLGDILSHVGSFLELNITPKGGEIFDQWYMNLERSVHAKRLDTYAIRLMPLLAVNEAKKAVDEEIIKKAIALCDWQLQVRKIHDPVDADNTIAKIEEKIRRILATGPKTDRELKQKTNANRTGIWIFDKAKRNLQRSREITWNKKIKCWEGVK